MHDQLLYKFILINKLEFKCNFCLFNLNLEDKSEFESH